MWRPSHFYRWLTAYSNDPKLNHLVNPFSTFFGWSENDFYPSYFSHTSNLKNCVYVFRLILFCSANFCCVAVTKAPSLFIFRFLGFLCVQHVQFHDKCQSFSTEWFWQNWKWNLRNENEFPFALFRYEHLTTVR